MVKDEVILIAPGPTGFFLRGIWLNELSDTIASKVIKFLFRQKPKRVDLPLNILSIGTVLKNAGFIPKLIDGRCENVREKLKLYLNNRTLFIGISSMTSSQIMFGLKTAEIVKKAAPEIPIVWGGQHPTALPEETLKTSDYVDIVCRKEGDITVVELANAIQKRKPLENIKGISFKDRNGNIVSNMDREFLDFNMLPLVNYGLLDRTLYDLSYINYQSSRGCPHRCKFCEVGPVHNRRYRSRLVQTMIDDIEKMIKLYSAREINLIDENFFVNLKNARDFANIVLERNLQFRWRAMCRADYFRRTDSDFWRLMKKAGCRIVNIGGESGSQKMLDYMNKDYKVSDMLNAATQLEEAALKSSFSFICGLPGEGKEDIEETIRLVDKLLNNFTKAYVMEIFIFTPLPMTAYYDELKKKGVIFPERLEDWGRFLFGDKKNIRWHPLNEYAFRVSLVSKWTVRIPTSKIFRSLLRFDIPMSLMYLCGYISYYRWRYKFFKFPIDLYIQHWLNKYIFKMLWQR